MHPEKDPEEIEALATHLEEHGIRVPKKDRLTGRDIGRMIRAARRRANAEALIGRIMGLVERAVYEVRDHEKVAEHFGLAREAYLHFTSPIRRYPDLMVHRWLHSIESRGAEAEEELKTESLLADLNDIASHASAQADVAEMVEVAVHDLKVCQYMHPHVGEKLDARVLRVSRAGMEVQLGGLQRDRVPARALASGTRAEVKGPTLLDQARPAGALLHRGPPDRRAPEGRRFPEAAAPARAGVGACSVPPPKKNSEPWRTCQHRGLAESRHWSGTGGHGHGHAHGHHAVCAPLVLPGQPKGSLEVDANEHPTSLAPVCVPVPVPARARESRLNRREDTRATRRVCILPP